MLLFAKYSKHVPSDYVIA